MQLKKIRTIQNIAYFLEYNPNILIFTFTLIHTLMNNASLCILIREALQSPEKVEALALAIDQFPEVRNLGRGWLPYYDQALLKTQNDIRRNIDDFPKRSGLNLETTNCQNPNDAENVKRKFIAWARMILKGDCRDEKKKQEGARKRNPDSHPKIISTNSPIGVSDSRTIEETIYHRETLNPKEIPSLDLLEKLIAQEELVENERMQVLRFRLLGESLKQFTERVTDKLNPFLESLASCYPRRNPQANCYELLKRRILQNPPQKWEDIAKELQIPFGTVTPHWKRRCEPLLLQIEENVGS